MLGHVEMEICKCKLKKYQNPLLGTEVVFNLSGCQKIINNRTHDSNIMHLFNAVFVYFLTATRKYVFSMHRSERM